MYAYIRGLYHTSSEWMNEWMNKYIFSVRQCTRIVHFSWSDKTQESDIKKGWQYEARQEEIEHTAKQEVDLKRKLQQTPLTMWNFL